MTDYDQQDNSNATERQSKYFAECKKNETEDPALSKWVKDIVIPKAIEEITAVINARNEATRKRRQQWELKQQQRFRKGKQPSEEDIKPREVTYPPFDRKGLKMGKPRCVRDRPQDGDGEEIEWTK